MASLAFYLFSSTHFRNSIKYAHLCKILYIKRKAKRASFKELQYTQTSIPNVSRYRPPDSIYFNIITTVITSIEIVNLIGQECDLIVLTCISIFDELPFVFMRGRDIHSRTSFVILCNSSIKRKGQSTTTYTLLYTYSDIFRWKSKD